MRKSDKKLDNQIRKALTQICEDALKDIDGFNWLTHTVTYSNFPQSMKVICVFDTNESLDRYLLSDRNNYFQQAVKLELTKLNVKVKHISNHVLFDTEENCEIHNDGNWALRLS